MNGSADASSAERAVERLSAINGAMKTRFLPAYHVTIARAVAEVARASCREADIRAADTALAALEADLAFIVDAERRAGFSSDVFESDLPERNRVAEAAFLLREAKRAHETAMKAGDQHARRATALNAEANDLKDYFEIVFGFQKAIRDIDAARRQVDWCEHRLSKLIAERIG